MPVMAATRAVRRSCSARCPDTPAPRRSQDTTSATQGRQHHTGRRRLPHRDDPEGQATGQRAGRHHEVHAPHEPAVAQPDLPVAGGDPREEQAAGRPLQQDRGGVQADHANEVRWGSAGPPTLRRRAGGSDARPRPPPHPRRGGRCRGPGAARCLRGGRAAAPGRAQRRRRSARHPDRRGRGRRRAAPPRGRAGAAAHRDVHDHHQVRLRQPSSDRGARRQPPVGHHRRRALPDRRRPPDLRPHDRGVRGRHPGAAGERHRRDLGLLGGVAGPGACASPCPERPGRRPPPPGRWAVSPPPA